MPTRGRAVAHWRRWRVVVGDQEWERPARVVHICTRPGVEVGYVRARLAPLLCGPADQVFAVERG